jgi:hypothetical protein
MSAPAQPRSQKQPRRRGACGHVYWSLQQALWWVLTRDLHAVSDVPASGSFAGLELRYCAEVLAGQRTASRALDFSTLATLQQQQIDRVEALMRTRYCSVRMQGGETLIPDYDKLEADLPENTWWALPWSEARLRCEWETARQQFERAKNELWVRIQDEGRVTIVGRPNGEADPRPIEPYYWPYYRLRPWNGDICAAPQKWGNKILMSRLKQNRLSGQSTIWLDLRVEAQAICDLWPVSTATSATASHPTPEAEERMRDAHARIQRSITRKWPGTSSLPSTTAMARALADDPSVKATGFGYETLRKMLTNRYPPFRTLGLVALPAGTRTKGRNATRPGTRKK